MVSCPFMQQALWEFLHISLDDQQKIQFFETVSMVQWADIKNYYISLQSLTRGKICCELWRTWEAFVSCVIKFHIFNTTIKKINDSFSGSLQWHFSGSLSFIVYRTIHSSYDNCMWFAWMSFFLSSSLSLKTRRDILISFQSAKYNKNIKFSWVLKRRIKKCIFLISMRWNDNVCKKIKKNQLQVAQCNNLFLILAILYK